MILILKNNEIIDILKDVSDDELQFYKTTIHPDAFYISLNENDFNWQLNENILLQLISYCNYLQNQIKDLQQFEHRLKLIENLLINELLFSPTFGKESEIINVHFAK